MNPPQDQCTVAVSVETTAQGIVDNPRMKKNNDYRGFRYPPEIIGYAVWLYHSFTSSYRDIEDLLFRPRIRRDNHFL